MKNLIAMTALVFSMVSINAFAEFKTVSCWKGFNNNEQQTNLGMCERQKNQSQKCSTSMWEHGQAAFDVCLLEAKGNLKLISVFKGFNNSEQERNMQICKKQETTNKICVSNIYVHKQAVFDVALMSIE